MPINADIQDLAAAEFLIMLSLNRKTGRLAAVNGDDKVMVAVRNGSIVYAASTSVRERVGSILVSRKLVSEEDLQAALDRQQSEAGVKHLGNILVEMGSITKEALEEVVRSQFQRVLAELLSWERGVISFETADIPDLGAVHMDPRAVITDMGFETEQLVLGTMSTLEDAQRDQQREAEAEEMMRSMMAEMCDLSRSLTAEMTVGLLQRATECVERGVLLLVLPRTLDGAGGFGVEQEGMSAEEVARQLSVPRAFDSVFAAVIASRRSFRGALDRTVANHHFVAQLGDAVPDEAIAIPLVVAGEVVAILYGDNAIDGESIGDTGRLEVLVAETEKALEELPAGGADQ